MSDISDERLQEIFDDEVRRANHFLVLEDKSRACIFAAMRRVLAEAQSAGNSPQPAPDADWIKWEGGECPVQGQHVQIKFRDGFTTQTHVPQSLNRWKHKGDQDDITAYRLLTPEKKDWRSVPVTAGMMCEALNDSWRAVGYGGNRESMQRLADALQRLAESRAKQAEGERS